MNSKLLAIGAAVVILVGAGGLLLFNKSNKPAPKTETAQTASPTPAAKLNSLLDLLSLGKTQKCNFSYTAQTAGKSEGTVFLSSNKMRADISTTTSGKVSKISMIRDGDTTYIWGMDLTAGVKMTLKKEDLKVNAQANQYLNTQQKADYKCGAWISDSATFVVPSNVKFTDISAMEKMISPTSVPSGSSSGSSQCAVCNNLTGAAKTACLSAYNCQ